MTLTKRWCIIYIVSYRKEMIQLDKLKLKALRVNSGMTQGEAAEQIGVERTTLLNWEKYKTFPRAPQLKKICDVYNCTISDIFFP